FHPDLYVWLINNWQKEGDKAEMLQNFLGIASLAEGQKYTINAKYHLQLEGVPVELYSRTRDYKEFGKSDRMLVRQLHGFTRGFVNEWIG
ncbi:MAG: dihydrodipicolinate synthase family protein, partial [Clostridiales bacterium]|nr:dihydrodipicolinate synthase family protein [Clostridiales bacterium]